MSDDATLKVMHPRLPTDCGPEQIARFEAEMRATARLFHPHLVAILDAGVDRDGQRVRPYYVMERVAGESLEERLARRGSLPTKKLRRDSNRERDQAIVATARPRRNSAGRRS